MRWSEVASWAERSVHPEMQWEAISRPAAIRSAPQPWSQEPISGYCGPDLRGPLIEVLREETGSPSRCWVCIWEGWGGIGDAFPEVPRIVLPDRNHLLFGTSLDVLMEGVLLGPGAQYAGPSLWWPEDRAWCVATEVDFRWTYVGGSATCIGRLLNDARLEALPTEPEHRGDYLSDTVNGPVRPC